MPLTRKVIALVAAAAVLATGGAAVAGRTLLAGPGSPAHDVTVASGPQQQQFEELLASIRNQPDTARDANFWYSRSVSRQPPATQDSPREAWIGHKRAGRILQGGRSMSSGPGPQQFGVVGKDKAVDWDGLWKLTSDPVKLATLMRQANIGAGPDPDTELFVTVGDMMRESPAPPKLRATLLQVAAADPGVKIVGRVKDPLGRPGFALERAVGDTSEVDRYIFDPVTGQLAAELQTDDGKLVYQSATSVQGPVATSAAVLPGPKS